MFVLILPGFSPKNKQETYSIAKRLQAEGLEVLVHEWPHWEDVRLQLRPEYEVIEISKLIDGKENLAIVSKSIGTYIALLLLQKHTQIKPERLVLLGVPLTGLKEEEQRIYPEMMAKFAQITRVIQNEHDPHGSSADVAKLLGDNHRIMQVMPGRDDHRYDYPQEVERILRIKNGE